MQPTPFRVASRGLWRAMTGGINLLVGGASLASAVAVQSSWFTVAAAGTYVVGLAVTLCRRPFWSRTVKELRCRPPELPHVSELIDPELKELLTRLGTARLERASRLNGLGHRALAQVEPLFEPIADLEASAVRIMRAADHLSRALAEGAGTRIFTRTKVLAARAEEAGDEFVKVELRRASQAAGQHASIVSQLASQQRKLIARLEWIAETLGLLSSRLLEAEVDPALAELASRDDSFDEVNAGESIRLLLGVQR
jgi:hypothetical protein